MAGEEYILPGAIGGIIIGLGIAMILILILALYIYTSLAWMTIGRKLNYKRAWLAWIPIANLAMVLQLGKFNWKWIFLIFIPILGWIPLIVLAIIAQWNIFESRKYPGWFSLSFLVPQIGGILSLIVLGFVAWSDRKKKLFS